jgi:hypothetical protein
MLEKEQYIQRHVRVCALLHLNISKEIGVKLDSEHQYKHAVKLVEKIREVKVTIVWNQRVQTDRIVPKNKPDIIICNIEKVTMLQFLEAEM